MLTEAAGTTDIIKLWFLKCEALHLKDPTVIIIINVIQILLFGQKLCHLGVFVSPLNINKLSMSKYEQGASKATKQPVKEVKVVNRHTGCTGQF